MWSVDDYPMDMSDPTGNEMKELEKPMERRIALAAAVVDQRVGIPELKGRIKSHISKDKE